MMQYINLNENENYLKIYASIIWCKYNVNVIKYSIYIEKIINKIYYKNPIYKLIEYNNYKILKLFIDYKENIYNKYKNILLYEAISNNCNIKIIKLLINNGANIYCDNNPKKISSYDLAINLQKCDIINYMKYHQEKNFIHIINKNRYNRYKRIPLYKAISYDYDISIIELLIDNGANIYCDNNPKKISPYDLAINLQKMDAIKYIKYYTRKNFIHIIHNYKLLKLTHNKILNNDDITKYIASFI